MNVNYYLFKDFSDIGILDEFAMEWILKSYEKEHLDSVSITPYELNCVYDGNTEPDCIDHIALWEKLNE